MIKDVFIVHEDGSESLLGAFTGRDEADIREQAAKARQLPSVSRKDFVLRNYPSRVRVVMQIRDGRVLA